MFHPPPSILNKVKENQNTKTIQYETQQAAKDMYQKDPIVQYNLEHFDTRTSGLVSNKNTEQNWAQPFEPIVGHTGLNMFPEIKEDMFQRKMEMFTGMDKTTFFSQKEAVANDPNLMAPEPILNTAVPNLNERVEFLEQGLLRNGNVKPFETQLVGARHIQPIFRPLPKIGADRTTNPKKTLEYQTVTPPASISKGSIAAQAFKNKVDRDFAMDRLGYTTTGAVIHPAQYGQATNKYQNRSETGNMGEQIFRHANTNTPLQYKSPNNFVVNTAKEGLQHQYIGNPDSFNGQALAMKGANNYHVNTEKEDVMTINHTGNASPFNDVEAQAAPVGKTHFISKDEILRGRKPTMCGPKITNVDVNVGFNKRCQLNVRGFTNGGTSTTERLSSSYKVKNTEIDLTERLDPCLNIPMLNNPYANALI